MATPTSDHVRTRLTAGTRCLLALINGYDGDAEGVLVTARRLEQLLRSYAGSSSAMVWTYGAAGQRAE